MRIGQDVAPALVEALEHEGLNHVDGAFAYAGGEELAKDGLVGRRRTRIRIVDGLAREHVLYLKRYGRERLKLRLARLLTYGRRRSPAGVEFDNIRAIRAAGISTMREVICGERFGLTGARRSYLIVSALPGDALERCFDDFLRRHNGDGAVERFTRLLGGMVAALHGAGYVHRDLYASHVFLHEFDGEFRLYLIDLARVFSPRWRRFRWRVKDLAQLKYSMPQRWVQKFWDVFLSEYLSGRDSGMIRRYNRAVDRKVAGMRHRGTRR